MSLRLLCEIVEQLAMFLPGGFARIIMIYGYECHAGKGDMSIPSR